jgi:archaellum component FlaC
MATEIDQLKAYIKTLTDQLNETRMSLGRVERKKSSVDSQLEYVRNENEKLKDELLTLFRAREQVTQGFNPAADWSPRVSDIEKRVKELERQQPDYQ